MLEVWWSIPWIRKVCSEDSSEVWNDGLQIHGHSYDHRYNKSKRLGFWSSRPVPILKIVWVIDVFSEYSTRYLFFYKHPKSVPGGTQTWELDSCKACSKIYSWDVKLWFKIYFIRWYTTSWIHRFRLGRECKRKKEYFRDVFQLGLRYDILGQ